MNPHNITRQSTFLYPLSIHRRNPEVRSIIMPFPENFYFIASTAAYQVEGAWNQDGKGESIWDRMVHTRPELINGKANGDIACNHYYTYKEDLKLVKEVGFNMYRFSISWPRILPNGDITNVNQLGIDHYQNVIDEILSLGLEPMITMYHWDLPQALQDMGGWTNPLMADYFEDYAKILFENFGDRVKWWITINEPIRIVYGYSTKLGAPATNLGSPADYIVAHTLLRAHGKAYRLYEKEFKSFQNGKISYVNDSLGFKPKTDSEKDIEATERAHLFYFYWFTNPIFSENGGYPESMKKIVDENSMKEGRRRSRLPEFTEEEINYIKGSADFFALNHYTSFLCEEGLTSDKPSFEKDANVILSSDPSWGKSSAFWLSVYPAGLRDLLLRVKENYNNPQVLILENGYADNGELEDNKRINYFKGYMTEVSNAINEDKCNITGYGIWSLMDDFEWISGYSTPFGILQVDFNDPERKKTLKSSAKYIKEIIENNDII